MESNTQFSKSRSQKAGWKILVLLANFKWPELFWRIGLYSCLIPVLHGHRNLVCLEKYCEASATSCVLLNSGIQYTFKAHSVSA